MTVSTPVLIGICLLCCTGNGERACVRLSLGPGYAAAISLLLALVSGAEVQLWRTVSILPVSLLLPVAAAIFSKGVSACGLLTAFTGATLGWLLQTLFPAFLEPCLLTAVPTVLLAVAFLKNRREQMAVTLLSPLLLGGLIALSDWYLFDDAIVALGSAAQLDAQTCGVLLLGLLLSVPGKKSAARKRFHQNEA